jgi:hypothetical protein
MPGVSSLLPPSAIDLLWLDEFCERLMIIASAGCLKPSDVVAYFGMGSLSAMACSRIREKFLSHGRIVS